MEPNNRDLNSEGYSDYMTNLYFNHYINQNNRSDTEDNHTSMKELINEMAASNSTSQMEQPQSEQAFPESEQAIEAFDSEGYFDAYAQSFSPVIKDSLEAFETDYDYMKSLYPVVVRKIQAEVDDQCDQLEYTGSCMFDEYPDKVHLSTIINTIYAKVQQYDKDDPELQAEELSYNPLTAMSYRRCSGFNCPPPPRMSDFNQYGRPNWMRNLIEVMLYNEMLYRRRRFKCRRCR